MRVKETDTFSMILVGNHCDKITEREVSREEGLNMARKLGCEFVEASAKTGVNVERSFYTLVRMIRLREKPPPESALKRILNLYRKKNISHTTLKMNTNESVELVEPVESVEPVDKFSDQRDINFSTCKLCERFNTGENLCHSCDPRITQEWTSENKEIDDFIKELQFEAKHYDDVIEWIEFHQLENIQKIGKGGFSTVYSANWINRKVALKSLVGTQNNPLEFLNEVTLKSFYSCTLLYCISNKIFF